MNAFFISLAVVVVGFAGFGVFVAVSLLRDAINYRWVNFKRDIFNDGHDFGKRGIEAYRREFTPLI